MHVRLDVSPASVVAVCGCGWRELFLTRPAARAGAVNHAVTWHDRNDPVRVATDRWLRRERFGTKPFSSPGA